MLQETSCVVVTLDMTLFCGIYQYPGLAISSESNESSRLGMAAARAQRTPPRPPPDRQSCEDVDLLPPPSTMLTMNNRQTRESLTNKIQRMEAGRV